MKLDRPLSLSFEDRPESINSSETDAPELEHFMGELASIKKELVECKDHLASLGEALLGNKGIRKELIRIENKLLWDTEKKLLNACKQIESATAIQAYMNSGELPLNYHGWPISPDLALLLINQIELNEYDLVVEFGSGTSTAIMAQASLHRGSRSQTSPMILSFDHDEHFCAQTRKSLESKGLGSRVRLIHAPLVPVIIDGKDYSYYDCRKELKSVNSELKKDKLRVLMFVDGPPGLTGPLARYPALPTLADELAIEQLDVVLDDTNREEEQSIASSWDTILDKISVRYTRQDMPLEKGAIVWSASF